MAETPNAHKGATTRDLNEAIGGMKPSCLYQLEKLTCEASQVTASQNNRHLTLTDPKSTAATHNAPSKGIFLEECAFQVTSPIVALFSKPTYNVRIQVENCSNKLQPNTFLLNTGAGFSVIMSKLLQNDWKHNVKSQPTPRLRSAIKEPIYLFGTILLFVQTGKLHVKV